MPPTTFPINLVPGSIAPRYDGSTPGVAPCKAELSIERVTITEQGTESHLPIVDFVLVAPNGDRYFATCTGRLVNMVSAAIKGVNVRNHGIAEP